MALDDVLRRNRNLIGSVMPIEINSGNALVFDFTANNREILKVFGRVQDFDKYVKKEIRDSSAVAGIGRYAEERVVYSKFPLFTGGEEPRTLHLGIDIFLPSGTRIFCPLPAILHSFCNNNKQGDYGPTIILEHALGGVTFYTLYGHLSLESLEGKVEGMKIEKGGAIGEIGSDEVNGRWPEHLHFQIISDMSGMKGDFPGVAKKSEARKYLELCPNPNLILNIPGLP